MELTKLILEFVKVLAWPITALVLALIFRAPLRAILSRLRRAGLPGGVSIDFQEQILGIRPVNPSFHVDRSARLVRRDC
jgi:hypothetical protein